ncbi:hypothetical protein FSP39_010589 [Pinctada imbricata]|uniref:Fatty acid hydroxylase domain-containing protein n=1 Tax=Pinctada imbricata TaxID=66713 RepID=A0AA88YSI0_PINIB|nr:hypothetical protein FSP39_010589 [Pinctada imbricata]
MGNFTETKENLLKLGFMCGVFVLATAARGDWLLVVVYLFRDYLQDLFPVSENEAKTDHVISLSRWRLQNLPLFIIFSVIVSFTMFWGMAWSWQWYYYIKRRDKSEEWKCQPNKFLSPKDERHEIMLGSLNMLLGSVASGIISCYIMNGGHTTLYYGILDRGLLYFLLSIPCFFLWIEVNAYYFHRLFHNPYLYKKVHKIHHRYHQPTAFSTTAMHPLEFTLHQSYLAIVPFVFPLHVGVFITLLLYVYYYGMCDHSGIKMDALWPWQPSSMFHDNHHRLFHVNFGFNSFLMDWLHDTLDKADREYGEDVFGGRGRPVKTGSR